MRLMKMNTVIGALLLLSLVSCNTPQSSETASAPSESSAAQSSPAARTADAKATLVEMQQVLTQTGEAVKASDFDKARATYKDFDEKYWEPIEDGVKEKSADTYKQVEEGMTAVSNNLKASQPNPTKTIAAIESLNKTLSNYASTVK